MPADDLTPSQLAALLEVDPSTLRRWARLFADHLSPGAHGKRRRYTGQDMATLTRARDLLRAGKPAAEVGELLATVAEESRDLPAVAALQLPALAAELLEARETLRALAAHVAELGAGQEADHARIADLESRLAAFERQGWLSRLLGRRPK